MQMVAGGQPVSSCGQWVWMGCCVGQIVAGLRVGRIAAAAKSCACAPCAPPQMIGMGGHCVRCGQTVCGHCVRGSVGKLPPPVPPPQCAQTVGIGGQCVGLGGQIVGTVPQIVGSAGHCVGRGQTVCGQLVIGSVGKLKLKLPGAAAAASSAADCGGMQTVSGPQIVGMRHCVRGNVGN